MDVPEEALLTDEQIRSLYTTGTHLGFSIMGELHMVADAATEQGYQVGYEKGVADAARKKAHFCTEWDFLLIDNTCPEFEACLCYSASPAIKGLQVALEATLAAYREQVEE